MAIDIGLRHSHRWAFVVVVVSFAILRADFLSYSNLDVSFRDRHLKDNVTSLDVVGLQSNLTSSGICTIRLVSTYDKILAAYSRFTKSRHDELPVKHKVTHHITGRLLPRGSHGSMEVARHEFDHMHQRGIIRPSSGNWSSPLLLVANQDSYHWRSYSDYRALNAITSPDQSPLPHTHDLGARLAGTKIYSEIDFMTACTQSPFKPSDTPKKAIITPLRLLELVRMPCGLKNAALTFQRSRDQVTRGHPLIFVHLGHIIFVSRAEEDHK